MVAGVSLARRVLIMISMSFVLISLDCGDRAVLLRASLHEHATELGEVEVDGSSLNPALPSSMFAAICMPRARLRCSLL